MKFADYEMKQHGEGWRWYQYPDFVVTMLRNPGTWSSWRNKAERAMRGRGDRRGAYYESLVDDSKHRAAEDIRTFGCNLPWDDEPLVEEEYEESDSSAGDESDSSADRVAPSSPAKGKNSKPKAAKKVSKDDAETKVSKKAAVPVVEVKPVIPLPPKDLYAHKRSSINLYWIDRSKLPCLFYDGLDKEEAEFFRVLPVCCTTYHCK
jgi:hypothetical protein